MNRMARVLGILCFVVAAVVLLLGDGPRRWYSGIFFVVIGVVMMTSAKRWRSATDE